MPEHGVRLCAVDPGRAVSISADRCSYGHGSESSGDVDHDCDQHPSLVSLAALVQLVAQEAGVNVHDIIREEAAKAGVSYEDVVGPRRIGRFRKVRRVAYVRARLETDKSWKQIAKVFNRDHTTIMYGVKKWS